MVRAFVAVLLPGELQDRIADIADRLKLPRTNVCFTKKEKLHVTLKFIGDTPADRLPEMGRLLHSVARRHEAFDVEIAGLGAFPTASRPRIVWVGTGQGSDQLKALSREVEQALARLGFSDENRFTSHITVARVRSPDRSGLLAAALKSGAGDIGWLRVEAIHLMKSVLSAEGSAYEVLHTCRLGGQGPLPERFTAQGTTNGQG